MPSVFPSEQMAEYFMPLFLRTHSVLITEGYRIRESCNCQDFSDGLVQKVRFRHLHTHRQPDLFVRKQVDRVEDPAYGSNSRPETTVAGVL